MTSSNSISDAELGLDNYSDIDDAELDGLLDDLSLSDSLSIDELTKSPGTALESLPSAKTHGHARAGYERTETRPCGSEDAVTLPTGAVSHQPSTISATSPLFSDVPVDGSTASPRVLPGEEPPPARSTEPAANETNAGGAPEVDGRDPIAAVEMLPPRSGKPDNHAHHAGAEGDTMRAEIPGQARAAAQAWALSTPTKYRVAPPSRRPPVRTRSRGNVHTTAAEEPAKGSHNGAGENNDGVGKDGDAGGSTANVTSEAQGPSSSDTVPGAAPPWSPPQGASPTLGRTTAPHQASHRSDYEARAVARNRARQDFRVWDREENTSSIQNSAMLSATQGASGSAASSGSHRDDADYDDDDDDDDDDNNDNNRNRRNDVSPAGTGARWTEERAHKRRSATTTPPPETQAPSLSSERTVPGTGHVFMTKPTRRAPYERRYQRENKRKRQKYQKEDDGRPPWNAPSPTRSPAPLDGTFGPPPPLPKSRRGLSKRDVVPTWQVAAAQATIFPNEDHNADTDPCITSPSGGSEEAERSEGTAAKQPTLAEQLVLSFSNSGEISYAGAPPRSSACSTRSSPLGAKPPPRRKRPSSEEKAFQDVLTPWEETHRVAERREGAAATVRQDGTTTSRCEPRLERTRRPAEDPWGRSAVTRARRAPGATDRSTSPPSSFGARSMQQAGSPVARPEAPSSQRSNAPSTSKHPPSAHHSGHPPSSAHHSGHPPSSAHHSGHPPSSAHHSGHPPSAHRGNDVFHHRDISPISKGGSDSFDWEDDPPPAAPLRSGRRSPPRHQSASLRSRNQSGIVDEIVGVSYYGQGGERSQTPQSSYYGKGGERSYSSHPDGDKRTRLRARKLHSKQQKSAREHTPDSTDEDYWRPAHWRPSAVTTSQLASLNEDLDELRHRLARVQLHKEKREQGGFIDANEMPTMEDMLHVYNFTESERLAVWEELLGLDDAPEELDDAPARYDEQESSELDD